MGVASENNGEIHHVKVRGNIEQLEIKKTSDGFHIEGYPDAVKLLGIDGPKAQRLADLGLHRADLNFALECVEQINQTLEHPYVLRQALWRSSVVHYIKCFGRHGSRFSLVRQKVYKGDPGAIEPFEYFDSLRNKHLVHDENSYAQCLPGAILNKKDVDHKIAKIVCLSLIGDTLAQENYSNLHMLLTQAREWVVDQFDKLCNVLTAEFEAEGYDALVERQGITYSRPGVDQIHTQRDAI